MEPKKPFHKPSLKTYNARHYAAIGFEIKPKVTWPSLMSQMYKHQTLLPSHLISVNGSTIHPAVEALNLGITLGTLSFRPLPDLLFHLVLSIFKGQPLTLASASTVQVTIIPSRNASVIFSW